MWCQIHVRTDVRWKICLTLHQWSHQQWGTLLPCCPISPFAPHFSCRIRGAMTHVQTFHARIHANCFDQSLITLRMPRQRHSLKNIGSLSDMTECSALQTLRHVITLQSTIEIQEGKLPTITSSGYLKRLIISDNLPVSLLLTCCITPASVPIVTTSAAACW